MLKNLLSQAFLGGLESIMASFGAETLWRASTDDDVDRCESRTSEKNKAAKVASFRTGLEAGGQCMVY